MQQTGEQLKLDGLDRVESNNRRWVDMMRERAIQIALAAGEVTIDDLRDYVTQYGEPRHKNAWGAVFRRSMGFRPVGRRKSSIPSNHARENRVWKYEAAPNV